jgi:hypothetical protein
VMIVLKGMVRTRQIEEEFTRIFPKNWRKDRVISVKLHGLKYK